MPIATEADADECRNEREYLDALSRVLNQGTRKPTRAKIDGRPIDALSRFGERMRFDLSGGFPLLTTKRMPFRAIVHELIWFLRGSTNIGYLRDRGVTIWDEWADADGELGPIYGKQWRDWGTGRDSNRGESKGRSGVDQIADLIRGVREVKADPTAAAGRRLIVTAWDPASLDRMALPPCHLLFQMMLTEGRLSCQLYQRSADMFLGVPFNIASYAILTRLIANAAGVEVGEFIHVLGDAHLYVNHLDQAREQLGRGPLPPPSLRVDIDPETAEAGGLKDLRIEQFQLRGYRSHPALKGDVAV